MGYCYSASRIHFTRKETLIEIARCSRWGCKIEVRLIKDDIDSLKYPDRGSCTKTIPILTSRGCPWNCKFCSSQRYWGKVRFHSAEYFIEEVKYILKNYRYAKRLYIPIFVFKRGKGFKGHFDEAL